MCNSAKWSKWINAKHLCNDQKSMNMCRNFRPKHCCIGRDTNKIALHAMKQFLQAVHHFRCRSYVGRIVSNWSAEKVLNTFFILFVPRLLDAFPTAVRFFWLWLSYAARYPRLSSAVDLNLLNVISISVSWRNRACCVKENFELLWCDVMECCLYIIGFLTCFTSLSDTQWCHKWGQWNL